MADAKLQVTCDYCGASYDIKFDNINPKPEFCCFCGEFYEPMGEVTESSIEDLDEMEEVIDYEPEEE